MLHNFIVVSYYWNLAIQIELNSILFLRLHLFQSTHTADDNLNYSIPFHNCLTPPNSGKDHSKSLPYHLTSIFRE